MKAYSAAGSRVVSGALGQSIRDAFLQARAVVQPVECAGCAIADHALCSRCVGALTARVATHHLADGTRVWAALTYSGAVRRCILAFKEHGRTDVAAHLAHPLRVALAHALAALPPGKVYLVTIPSSRAAWRRRGYAPVAALMRKAGTPHARWLAAACADARTDARMVASQKSLGVAARHRNRQGSLRALGAVKGRTVLVVDDVMTSGATLDEAVRAIRQAGGHVVGAVVLAHTPRRFGIKHHLPAGSRDLSAGEDYGERKGAKV